MEAKEKESDTPNCDKCGCRTALIIGYWNYHADSEPYNNGVQEESVNKEGESYIGGFICDECHHIQGLWVED
ncbi:hypothetical protein [Elizabethkingia meningoseptica]|uniref:hypothetical protein n=1 Tax=Elizabethkingia meningoseptica TaxID=238 RepID=UPI00162A560A|nr:hypothetical protein [Elizabethkingia meningoseptica]MDE5432992.1 hypothetical protein [Elizabethkingia meningoseptica]HAY3553799.1 hypothetical protein [Elizabethkingia meningoseptica]